MRRERSEDHAIERRRRSWPMISADAAALRVALTEEEEEEIVVVAEAAAVRDDKREGRWPRTRRDKKS